MNIACGLVAAVRAVGARGCVGSCEAGGGSRLGVRGGCSTVGGGLLRDCAENSSVSVPRGACAYAFEPAVDACGAGAAGVGALAPDLKGLLSIVYTLGRAAGAADVGAAGGGVAAGAIGLATTTCTRS